MSKSHQFIHPMIYERTRDGEMLYDIYSRLIKERIVFLADVVDVEVATTTAATFLFLESQSKTKPISLYINSPGGTLHDGLFTIYDAINYVECPIRTVCLGEAASAAATILAAGSPGLRLATPNSLIMIHQMQISEMSGSGTDMINEAERIKEWNERLYETLARHCGHTVEEISKVCKDDTYFTAVQAKEFGLIDEIIPPKKKIPELITKAKAQAQAQASKARRRKAP